jgi:hypothetical protein
MGVGAPPSAFDPQNSLTDPASKNEAIRHGIRVLSNPIVVGSSAVDAPATSAKFPSLPTRVQGVFPLTLEVESAQGARVALPSIQFEAAPAAAGGMEFNSSQQSRHWRISVKIDPVAGRIDLRFALNYSNLNADQALRYIRFYQALARGGEIRISGKHLITGSDFLIARGAVRPGEYEGPDVRFVEVLERLALIESKTGVSFNIPEGDISGEEVRNIAATARILTTGHARYKAEPWVSVSTLEQARGALETYDGGESRPTALHFQGQAVVVFGTKVPLGPVTFFCDRTYITEKDMEELRRNVATATLEGKINIRFTPFEDCPIEARYINWVPADEAAALRQLPMYRESPHGSDEGEELLGDLLVTPKPMMTEVEFAEYLAAKGVVTLPQPLSAEELAADDDDWEPIEVTGEPLSQMIIRERR